jgi:hypothetical protein
MCTFNKQLGPDSIREFAKLFCKTAKKFDVRDELSDGHYQGISQYIP